MLVSLARLSIPRLAYLLQRGVRDAVAGQAEVSHGQVELLEEQGKGPISGSTIRQYVGDLLTDALQEDCLRDVALHKLTHRCQICQTDSRKITQQLTPEDGKLQRIQTTDLCGKYIFPSLILCLLHPFTVDEVVC